MPINAVPATTLTTACHANNTQVTVNRQHAAQQFARLHVDRHCVLMLLPQCCHAGLCRHVYTERMSGVAGFFTPHQLIRLLDCLPADSIDFVEQDYKVNP